MDLREPTTFSRVYAEHAAEVESIARRVLGDGSRAQDVAHDVFLRLWTNPGAFDPERGEVGPYLRLLARSRAIDAQRSRRAGERAGERFRHSAFGGEPSVAELAPASAEMRDVRRELGRALSTLPDAQREAVVLAYWGDLPDTAVAQRSGVPLGTAKSRIRLGLQRLRAAYQPA